MSSMRLKSVNGNPTIEYRAIDGHPVPYQVTIQRRALDADGDEYRDGGSQWETISVRDVVEQVKLDGPVAAWLREHTRVDTSPSALTAAGDLDNAAYMWNINAGK